MVFNLEIGETKTVARSALGDWIDTGPEAVSFSLPRAQYFWTRFFKRFEKLALSSGRRIESKFLESTLLKPMVDQATTCSSGSWEELEVPVFALEPGS